MGTACGVVLAIEERHGVRVHLESEGECVRSWCAVVLLASWDRQVVKVVAGWNRNVGRDATGCRCCML
jgi:hypothetical protein